MNLPEGWVEACGVAEDRLKNFTPIEPINASFCLEQDCPAAKVLDIVTPFGQNRMVYCMFSKCLRRYPSKKELKYLK